jgi:L-serine/L-threonine ammonia-lyase
MTDPLAPLHIETPLLAAAPGRGGIGEAWFKLDALQPSGSFKLRGVGRLCQQAAREGASAIVCASGGNAGYAAAYAGRRLGLPVTIIVPETTSEEARSAIAALGAGVVVAGASFDDADERARSVAAETGAAYVHPFDDPRLWDGHATLIDEVVRSGADFDCVVTSVGGGGLLLGVLQGLGRNGLAHLPVLAVETEGADALARSLAAGARVTLPAVTSIATSLGARRVAAAAFEAARDGAVRSVVVTDREAVEGCVWAADRLRLLVEPACGAAVAALWRDGIIPGRRPLVEVCGGIGVSLDRLEGWRRRFGLR